MMDQFAAETSSRRPFTYASDTGLVSVRWRWKSYSWSVRVMLIPSSLSLNVKWTYVIYVKWFCFEVKFLWTKVPCTLGWPYTEGAWLYCNYFTCCVSCNVVVLTCFVMCGCFGNVYLYLLYFLLFVTCFCIVSFMYIYSYLFCLY